MEDSLARLTSTNEALTKEVLSLRLVREELATMKLSFDPLQQRALNAERELEEARADKSALEQEVRLSAAQRASKRRTLLISTVPKAICVVGCVIFGPIMMTGAFGGLPAYYCIGVALIVGFLLLLGFMSVRATDVLAIRALSVGCYDCAIQNMVMNGPLGVVFLLGHPTSHIQPGWRPYGPFNILVASFFFALAAGWGWFILLKPMQELKHGRKL